MTFSQRQDVEFPGALSSVYAWQLEFAHDARNRRPSRRHDEGPGLLPWDRSLRMRAGLLG
jgi:hypothetical protein